MRLLDLAPLHNILLRYIYLVEPRLLFGKKAAIPSLCSVQCKPIRLQLAPEVIKSQVIVIVCYNSIHMTIIVFLGVSLAKRLIHAKIFENLPAADHTQLCGQKWFKHTAPL